MNGPALAVNGAPDPVNKPPRERPIIFSGEMVRAILFGAILAGEKTQTRRVIWPQPTRESSVTGPMWTHTAVAGSFAEEIFGSCFAKLAPCRFGRPGDRLWVREQLREGGISWFYAADSVPVTLPEGHPAVPEMISWTHHHTRPHCLARYMPRWASRITLEVTEVRAQRLQDISEEDARAEGVQLQSGTRYLTSVPYSHEFGKMWESINGKRAPWASNPWVWALTFRRLP